MRDAASRSGGPVANRARRPSVARCRGGVRELVACLALWPALAGVALGAGGDVGIGPVAVGDDPGVGLFGSTTTYAGFAGTVLFSRMPDRRVDHVVFVPERDLLSEAGAAAPGHGEVVERLERTLGVRFARHTDGGHVWESAANAHAIEVRTVETAGAGSETRIVVRTADPARTCGPEDGFLAWFEAFGEALALGRHERLAEAFAEPFLDHVAAVMAYGPDQTMHVDDAQALQRRLSERPFRAFLADLASAPWDCDPVGYEGHAGGYRLLVEGGAVQALREPEGWRFVVRYYVP